MPTKKISTTQESSGGARQPEVEVEPVIVDMVASLGKVVLQMAKSSVAPRIAQINFTKMSRHFVGFVLVITELDPPAPFVNQPMTVRFALVNITSKAASGYVEADAPDFGEVVRIDALPPGQQTDGSFIYTPAVVGRKQVVALSFAVTEKATSAPTPTPANKSNRGSSIAPDVSVVMAHDEAEFDVRTAYILEVNGAYQNPSPPTGDSWNGAVCHNHTAFDAGHLLDDDSLEWSPVLTPGDEWGGDVAMSGTVCEDHLSGGDDDFDRDMPFTHPFHNDWEMFVAPDESYRYLLAPTQGKDPDAGYKLAIAYADAEGLPEGFLGVEIQRAFLNISAPISPFDDDRLQYKFDSPYRAHIGDRVAMLGRWIVDCGHDNFTTEIHEPLLLAIGRREQQATTGIRLIGRPFFVSQMFGGHSLSHAMTVGFGERLDEGHLELWFPPLLALLSPVELRPTVVSPPFRGKRNLPLTVRACIPRPSASHILRASYHFTVRNGVSVTVSPSGYDDEVVLTISMDDGEYTPATLPPHHNVNVQWTGPHGLNIQGQAGQTLQAVIDIAGALDSIVAAVWEKGFDTDRYDLPGPGGVHDSENVVLNAVVTRSSINAKGSGFAVDNDQPYPIYGWLTLQWFDQGYLGSRAANVGNLASVAAGKMASAESPQRSQSTGSSGNQDQTLPGSFSSMLRGSAKRS